MRLEKLSDDELDAYSRSLYDREEQQDLFLSRCINKVNATGERIKKIQDTLEDIKAAIHDRQIQYAGRKCMETITNLNVCTSNLHVITTNIGYTETEETITADKISIEVEEQDGNILHIIFPELLPRRPKNVSDYPTTQYRIERAKYQNAFSDYFKDKRYRIYDEKAVLCFIHHFCEEHNIRDHDNFDTKLIIDYLAAYILVDDSAKYCAHYMDYVMDERDYSEIYVVPQKKIIEFLKALP